jgi:hypothetical protein
MSNDANIFYKGEMEMIMVLSKTTQEFISGKKTVTRRH